MELQLDFQQLRQLLESFHCITHVNIGIFSPEGEGLCAIPETDCSFCRILKSDPRFCERCIQQNREAFRIAREKGLYLYRCHAGLYEAVIPLMCENTPAVYLMLGQAVPDLPVEQSLQELARRLKGHSRLEELLAEFPRMPRRTEEEVRASARIMEACAGYIYLNSLVFPSQDSLSVQLQRYIQANFSRYLSLREMADALGVGVTRMCTAVRSECGTTPHAMLTEYRMHRARQLLRQTKLPVREIAARVGLADYNYFSRRFRQCTGCSHSEYRRRAVSE